MLCNQKFTNLGIRDNKQLANNCFFSRLNSVFFRYKGIDDEFTKEINSVTNGNGAC